jgi:glucose/arabinose dehydrogenase
MCGCSIAAALAMTTALAQQDVPFNNGIPVAPNGIPVPPLPDQPRNYQTAEGQDIRVVVYARGLTRPWSIAFLPNGDKLVMERTGALRLIRDDVLDPNPVPGVPEVRAVGLSGLFDIALHPNFADNA